MLGGTAALIFFVLFLYYINILHNFYLLVFFSSNLTAEVVPYNKIIKVVIVNGIYLLFQIKFSHSSVISNILLKNRFTVQSLPLKTGKLHRLFFPLLRPQMMIQQQKKDSLGDCPRWRLETGKGETKAIKNLHF